MAGRDHSAASEVRCSHIAHEHHSPHHSLPSDAYIVVNQTIEHWGKSWKIHGKLWNYRVVFIVDPVDPADPVPQVGVFKSVIIWGVLVVGGARVGEKLAPFQDGAWRKNWRNMNHEKYQPTNQPGTVPYTSLLLKSCSILQIFAKALSSLLG